MAIDPDKAFEVPSGIKIEDDGPFITGGAASPIGLGLPQDTVYHQTTATGIVTWIKSGVNDDPIDWGVGVPNEELNHRGWENVADTTYTDTVPFDATKNVRTLIPLNSDSVVNSQIPDGVTTFWNDTTNTFEPDRIGDFYFLRFNFQASASKNFSTALVELDIGGSQGTIWSDNVSFNKGANVFVSQSFGIPVFTLGTFVTNGGQFFITGSNNLEIYEQSLVIFRTFRGRD